ncbi:MULTISPECIES: PH domain-containing protein [unclassified Brachybacterium]|uniref:PH domain-containing protein n=1 Tax=unclassified Brachybacterium TaxID=2623841 RepID=UPI0036088084
MDSGNTLYVAQLAPAWRIMQWVGFAVLTVLAAGAAAAVAVLSVLAFEGGQRPVAIAVAAAVLVPWSALIVYVFRVARLAMIVTTEGITVRELLRTRRVPWEQVHLIDEAPHWYHRRLTCIVLTDGTRIAPLVTNYLSLRLRGEPWDRAARDRHVPMVPTRQAAAAHRRWLRGEFAPSP